MPAPDIRALFATASPRPWSIHADIDRHPKAKGWVTIRCPTGAVLQPDYFETRGGGDVQPHFGVRASEEDLRLLVELVNTAEERIQAAYAAGLRDGALRA